MNTFQSRKIRLAPKRKPLSEKAKQQLLTVLGIVLLLLALYVGGVKVLNALSGTRLLGFFTDLFGKDLLVDGNNHTNILLLGNGGEGHEGKDLTDTMIIASIDHNEKFVSLFSLPRDLYTDSSLGESRVNRLYEKGKLQWDSTQGLDFVRKTIEDLIALPIHYAVRVDFEAATKIVDAVDGVDVYVEETIDDPLYPKDGTFEYEPFFLAKGNQHLDGATALKYVRSRKSTSDFDRSRRQQQVLVALKNKARNENLLTSKRFLKDMYYTLREHVETNMSLREMISLAGFAADWDSKKIAMATLNDEPTLPGGLLYVPARDLYGGAYVLIPAGDNFKLVQAFIKLVLYGPKNRQQIEVAVLNGTETSGLAAVGKSILTRFGIHVTFIGNARQQNLPETTWYVAQPLAEPLASALKELIPGKISNQTPAEYQTDADFQGIGLILEIGKDVEKILATLDVYRNMVTLKKPTPAATSPAPTEPPAQ